VQVRLLRYTPEPELVIAAASRSTSAGSTATEIMDKMTPDYASRMIKQLISAGHLSPLEHASFTFSLEGISRACSHQLVRHRLASYSQQSQRFVHLKEPKFVTPPSFSTNPQMRARYQEMMKKAHQFYQEMLQAGMPMEDARYILPGGMETNLVMTMNTRELLHAAALRLCPRSQWEIVGLFEKIKAEIERVAPTIGEELRPKCYKLTYCDEPKSCGLFPTLKETAKTK
jgi:thymidylate synthase (FAD)